MIWRQLGLCCWCLVGRGQGYHSISSISRAAPTATKCPARAGDQRAATSQVKNPYFQLVFKIQDCPEGP